MFNCLGNHGMVCNLLRRKYGVASPPVPGNTTAPDNIDRRAVRRLDVLVTDATLIRKQQLQVGVLE